MLKGVIDFLLSQKEDAKVFLDNFVVLIVPMMNPDGVFRGKLGGVK